MKSFTDRPHNWNEILISTPTKKLTRGQIKSYYEKNIDKIYPFLKNHDVLVILGISKNKFVLKRLLKDKNIHINTKYGINNSHSFEYWINRRVIEFHPVLEKLTDVIWVDIDVHSKGLNSLAKKLSREIKLYFEEEFKAKTKIYKSGRDKGLHVEGYLKRKIDVNIARDKIKEFLKTLTDNKITTGIAKKGQIRLDITTLKRTGSLRAPFSLSVSGNVKKSIL